MRFSTARLTLGLLTRDIERSQRFYQKLLDARYEHNEGERRNFSIAGQRLTLIQNKNGSQVAHAGTVQLQYRVPFTATELKERAESCGTAIETVGENTYRLDDPDGNELLHTQQKQARCRDEACPWSASLFHVLVAHRPAATPFWEGE